MVNVMLCDDNRQILDYYESVLKETAKKNGIDIRISRCESGEQLLFFLSNNPNSMDIIYLDILMGKMNGMEAARKLREIDCVAQIIYLTTSDEYVFEAFDVDPFYYIVKDEISLKKFREIFLKAVDTIKRKANDYILVTYGATMVKLQLDKILYFEVTNRQITVHTTENSIEYYSTMETVEQQLAGRGFIRCHRSYLVNCYHIEKLARTQITLSNGEELPVSPKYSKDVQTQFSKYLLTDKK